MWLGLDHEGFIFTTWSKAGLTRLMAFLGFSLEFITVCFRVMLIFRAGWLLFSTKEWLFETQRSLTKFIEDLLLLSISILPHAYVELLLRFPDHSRSPSQYHRPVQEKMNQRAHGHLTAWISSPSKPIWKEINEGKYVLTHQRFLHFYLHIPS